MKSNFVLLIFINLCVLCFRSDPKFGSCVSRRKRTPARDNDLGSPVEMRRSRVAFGTCRATPRVVPPTFVITMDPSENSTPPLRPHRINVNLAVGKCLY